MVLASWWQSSGGNGEIEVCGRIGNFNSNAPVDDQTPCPRWATQTSRNATSGQPVTSFSRSIVAPFSAMSAVPSVGKVITFARYLGADPSPA